MPKIQYESFNFSTEVLDLFNKVNRIVREYQAEGYLLTLRQIYYQMIRRDWFPENKKYLWTNNKWIKDLDSGSKNAEPNYKWLGKAISDGRLAGIIDWNAIEDRTRNLNSFPNWETPAKVIESAANAFQIDKWDDQPYRVEVWIEKEALSGVFQRICGELDVPFLACKGYTSQSEMWGAAMRFVRYIQAGKTIKVLHFGDHDPSGIDMTRDIEERLKKFVKHHVGANVVMFEFERVALNMEQIEQSDAPPAPAKITDTRYRKYQEAFGDDSWELDALTPQELHALVRDKVAELRDDELWRTKVEHEAGLKAIVRTASQFWPSVQNQIELDYPGTVEDHTREEIERWYPSEE